MIKYRKGYLMLIKNIFTSSKNILTHFTGIRKHILFSLIIIFACFLNILVYCKYNTSALTYQSSVGVGFTFNPSISVSLSGDLVINNLIPGSTSDSNIISVAVSTNASHGYNLSATVGEKNGTDALVNGSSTFSNLTANKANLSNFTDNTWGYSYSLDNGTTWISGNTGSTNSGYNGLPLDNNDNPEERGLGGVTLIDTSNPIDNQTIKFKIGARASSSQPAGTYTNTINFYAVVNPAPMVIDDLINLQEFATLPADDLSSVRSLMIPEMQYTLKDARDDKTYSIAKLADGNIWMTQSLDLDLDTNTTYTSADTDLPNGVTWTPNRGTYQANDHTWVFSDTTPESYNPGEVYWNGIISDNNDWYSYIGTCSYNIPYECDESQNPFANYIASSGPEQYRLGNYYNWTAAMAMNDSSSIAPFGGNSISTVSPDQSICPAGWTMPRPGTGEDSFHGLLSQYGFENVSINGNNNVWSYPLYFILRGRSETEEVCRQLGFYTECLHFLFVLCIWTFFPLSKALFA